MSTAKETPPPPIGKTAAFRQGWDAYFEGKRKGANPFDAGDSPRARQAWNDGHAAAAQHEVEKGAGR